MNSVRHGYFSLRLGRLNINHKTAFLDGPAYGALGVNTYPTEKPATQAPDYRVALAGHVGNPKTACSGYSICFAPKVIRAAFFPAEWKFPSLVTKIWLGFLTEEEARNGPGWTGWLDALRRERRAACLHTPRANLWIAAERLGQFAALLPDAKLDPAPGALVTRPSLKALCQPEYKSACRPTAMSQ